MPAVLRPARLEYLPGVNAMAERTKPSPAGSPPAPPIAQVADAGVPRVSVRIEGGPRGEEYRLHFDATAGGTVLLRFKSDLAGYNVEESRGEIAPAEFDRLLRSADVTRLRAARRSRMPPIPPCSVIGRLEVFDGRERTEVLFMADPEQAREAGYRIPPAVARLTERIYTIAAQQLGLKNPAAVAVGGR